MTDAAFKDFQRDLCSTAQDAEALRRAVDDGVVLARDPLALLEQEQDTGRWRIGRTGVGLHLHFGVQAASPTSLRKVLARIEKARCHDTIKAGATIGLLVKGPHRVFDANLVRAVGQFLVNAYLAHRLEDAETEEAIIASIGSMHFDELLPMFARRLQAVIAEELERCESGEYREQLELAQQHVFNLFMMTGQMIEFVRGAGLPQGLTSVMLQMLEEARASVAEVMKTVAGKALGL